MEFVPSHLVLYCCLSYVTCRPPPTYSLHFYHFTHHSLSIPFRSLFLSSVNSLLRLHLLFHPASMRFRYLKFTRKVFTDVCKVLLLGKRCVLQCLLKIRSIFEHTDSHYLLNKLFLGDYVWYCLWTGGYLSSLLLTCLPACLPACLLVCLSVCLPSCLPACVLKC